MSNNWVQGDIAGHRWFGTVSGMGDGMIELYAVHFIHNYATSSWDGVSIFTENPIKIFDCAFSSNRGPETGFTNIFYTSRNPDDFNSWNLRVRASPPPSTSPSPLEAV